jgi:hypothetical protein
MHTVGEDRKPSQWGGFYMDNLRKVSEVLAEQKEPVAIEVFVTRK